jgi:hypothetical protein
VNHQANEFDDKFERIEVRRGRVFLTDERHFFSCRLIVKKPPAYYIVTGERV